ncbi:hypothetical protein ACHHYP_05981 [Achlya hypogyna]|uniref:Calmodulin n=1 Tax=Achlya hypogyna TaxID=1202772 RepID=A0A1V9YW40_ACHHY|nr:hypothetical protein ACHHYP_05981 [Achlya hypogyna]
MQSTGPIVWSPPSPLEQSYYDSLFGVADEEKAGAIGGRSAVLFFSKSGLDKAILREIWTIADSRQASQLQVGDFYVAMRLIAMAQQGQPVTRQRFFELAQTPFTVAILQGVPPPAMPAPPSAPSYAILDDEKTKYNAIFAQYDTDGDGFITGPEAAALFQMSGLDRESLRVVWTLADRTADGRLDLTEFYIAMHFIVCVTKRGMSLPPAVPYEMEQSLRLPVSRGNSFQQPPQQAISRGNSFQQPPQPGSRANSFGQSQGSFGQSQGSFVQSQGSFGQSQGSFGQSQGSFGPPQGSFGSFGQSHGGSAPSPAGFGSNPSAAPATEVGFSAFDALAPDATPEKPSAEPRHDFAAPDVTAPLPIGVAPSSALGGFNATPQIPATASRAGSFGSSPPMANFGSNPPLGNFGSNPGLPRPAGYGSNSRPPPSPAASVASSAGAPTANFGSHSGVALGSDSAATATGTFPPPATVPPTPATATFGSNSSVSAASPAGFGSNSGFPAASPAGLGSNSGFPAASPAGLGSNSGFPAASPAGFGSNSGFPAASPAGFGSNSGFPAASLAGFASNSGASCSAGASSHPSASTGSFGAFPPPSPALSASSLASGHGNFGSNTVSMPSPTPSSTAAGLGAPALPDSFNLPAADSGFDAFQMSTPASQTLSHEPSTSEAVATSRAASLRADAFGFDAAPSATSFADQFGALSLASEPPTEAFDAFAAPASTPAVAPAEAAAPGLSAVATASAAALDSANGQLHAAAASLAEQQVVVAAVVRVQALVAELLQLALTRDQRKAGPDPALAASLQRLIDDERALISATSAAIERLEAKAAPAAPKVDPFTFASP